MRKPKPVAKHSDIGTPERHKHGDTISIVETARAGIKAARVDTQSMLDRYRVRRQITQAQYDAGIRLYGKWYAAGASPMVIASYGQRIGGNGDVSEHQAMLRCQVTQVLRAMTPAHSGMLVRVCLCDEAAGGDMEALRDALTALAQHWGMAKGEG